MTIHDVRINWIVKADIECPNCEEVHDFMDQDEWWAFCQIAETKDFDKRMQHKITCKCGHELIVTGSDY